jgi:uncharacterized membrane protein
MEPSTTTFGKTGGARSAAPPSAGGDPSPSSSTSTRRSRRSSASGFGRSDRRSPARRLVDGLGWASIALGLAELLAPRSMARLVGIRDHRNVQRVMMLMGLRELASGVGILAARRRGPWLWLRLGGDVVDIAVLRAWRTSSRNDGLRLAGAMTAVAGVTALDVLAARRAASLGREPVTTTAVITVARVPEEVYAFWRDLRNLPRFMVHLDSVEPLDERRSHWKAVGPARVPVEWDAEIVEDRFAECIAWRSLPGADVDNSGVVRFVPAPGGRGTEIHVTIRYAAPGGQVGRAIARLLGREPGQQARGDLRRLKQVLETGGVVHSDASIHPGPHPARPPSAQERVALGLPDDLSSSQRREAAQ